MYIDLDKSKTPGLYRMDLSGGRRERVKDLEILENDYWPGRLATPSGYMVPTWL